jgi:NAD-dependent deacetylase
MKARSTRDPDLVTPIAGWELNEGDLCAKGSQLRPHIVWFGEQVPLMPAAEKIVSAADVLLVVGTSLQVYPAAGLAWCAPTDARRFLIDPHPPNAPGFTIIAAGASDGLTQAAGRIFA